MKFKSIILGIIFIVGFGILIPYFLVMMNQYLGLPIINSPLLKFIGVVLLLFGLSIFFYATFIF